MPNLKLQVSRALNVIPSDDTNIPMPNVITSGNITGTSVGILIDSGRNFSSSGVNPLNVQVGDIVYNITANQAAMVTNVDSATQLTLNAPITMTIGDGYILYSGTNITGTVEPSVLYVGTGGDLEVTTAGGDIVYLYNIPSGSFLPIQVIKVGVSTTTASNIVALW
jgi:hypothetical protein